MNKTNKVLLKSLLTNTFLVASKITFGFLGNFKSLIADGIHSLSDLTTDIIAIFGNHMALKPADSKHPFGHGKIEYLTSIIIGLIISALSLILITSSLIGNSTKPSNIVIYVSFITVILKCILASYILKKGYQYKNNILIASGKESKTDVLSTFVVIIAFFLTKLTKYNHLFNYADSLATIIVALFILNTGINILKENIISIIGEKETNQEYINLIKEIILSDERIKKIDELEIMKYGSYYQVNIDISIKDNLTIKEGNSITNNYVECLTIWIEQLTITVYCIYTETDNVTISARTLDNQIELIACLYNLLQTINHVAVPCIELRNARLDSILLVKNYIVVVCCICIASFYIRDGELLVDQTLGEIRNRLNNNNF